MAGIPIQRLNNKRKKPLTEMQEQALRNFVANGYTDIRQALLDAGYSPNNLTVAARSLKSEMIELAEELLVSSAPRAAVTITGIMTSDEAVSQASNKLDAAKTVLDRIGLGKKDQLDVHHEVSGGIAILPPKRIVEEADVYEE